MQIVQAIVSFWSKMQPVMSSDVMNQERNVSASASVSLTVVGLVKSHADAAHVLAPSIALSLPRSDGPSEKARHMH